MAKRFRELVDIVNGILPPTQEKFVFFHFKSGDTVAKFILANLLVEDRKHVDLGKGREVFYHTAHVPRGQDHLHFYQNDSKLYALNRDGTAHDASHGKKMSRWATDAVKDNYPGFTLPKGGLIEAFADTGRTTLLLEENGWQRVLVDNETQTLSEANALEK